MPPLHGSQKDLNWNPKISEEDIGYLRGSLLHCDHLFHKPRSMGTHAENLGCRRGERCWRSTPCAMQENPKAGGWLPPNKLRVLSTCQRAGGFPGDWIPLPRSAEMLGGTRCAGQLVGHVPPGYPAAWLATHSQSQVPADRTGSSGMLQSGLEAVNIPGHMSTSGMTGKGPTSPDYEKESP